MSGLNIVYQNIAALKPFARNARIHSKKQLNQIGGLQSYSVWIQSGSLDQIEYKKNNPRQFVFGE